MTDKERLEEIKRNYNEMQAQNLRLQERVQELENDIKEWETVNELWEEVNENLAVQNKRYREQLELIRKDTFYEEHEFVSVRHLIRKRVDKALKGE